MAHLLYRDNIDIAQRMCTRLSTHLQNTSCDWKIDRCGPQSDSISIVFPNSPFSVGIFYNDVDDTPGLMLYDHTDSAINCPTLGITDTGSYSDDIHNVTSLIKLLDRIAAWVYSNIAKG